MLGVESSGVSAGWIGAPYRREQLAGYKELSFFLVKDSASAAQHSRLALAQASYGCRCCRLRHRMRGTGGARTRRHWRSCIPWSICACFCISSTLPQCSGASGRCQFRRALCVGSARRSFGCHGAWAPRPLWFEMCGNRTVPHLDAFGFCRGVEKHKGPIPTPRVLEDVGTLECVTYNSVRAIDGDVLVASTHPYTTAFGQLMSMCWAQQDLF